MIPKNDNREIRRYTFEMRADNNEQYGDFVTGKPILYNSLTNIGGFDEIIEAGALDGADLKDVRFLVNHNTDMIPLARSRNNNENSTMQMIVDSSGMNIRVNLDTANNSEAKNLYSAIQRGDIDGMSFMFTVEADEWENLESDHPTRHIRKIGKVFEVSAVTFPAYPETSISARNAQTLDNARAALDSAKVANNEIEVLRMKALINSKI